MTFSNQTDLLLFIVLLPLVYFGWPRYRFRRVRDSVSLALRVVIVTLVVLALAGAQLRQSTDRLAVIFLVDVSDSMGTDFSAQADFIRAAVENKAIDDEVGIVLFGANALPERTLSNLGEIVDFTSDPDTTQTNFAAAINLALSMFSDNTAKRIVVLSDGIPTSGNALQAAELAAASGVEISYVPFTPQAAPEVQLLQVDAPETVIEGQVFDINVTIEATQDTTIALNIYSGGQQLLTEDAVRQLRSGLNNFTFTLPATASGPQSFQVLIKTQQDADHYDQNNRLYTFTNIVGSPRVLVVSRTQAGETIDELQYLIPALEQSGLAVERATPGTLPINIQQLIQYDTIIIANVPADQFASAQLDNLKTYVRDLGGGLVVIGGPESYAPGFYMLTPLEDVLPVEMQLRDQQRLPQLTVAYLIDRSGSMGIPSADGVPNIELAKKAIIDSIEFLQATDRAAVASFDTNGYWIAPFQDVLDRRELQRLVATLRAGGGTDILAGMTLVARDIVNEPSQRKHIILLTDGGADARGLVELTESLFIDHNVTTSVIAIGQGAAPFLREMAQVGGGNYHLVTNVAEIPLIFAQETVLASRSYIVEESFFPLLTANNPMIQGIDALPQLNGYVATTPKTAAQVVLRGTAPFEDPILVGWQYGLGRAVAFTSDATARWASEWVAWEGYARFWGQVVQWAITEGASENLQTQVIQENGQAHIIVDARADDGAFLNNLTLQSGILMPNGQQETISLRQIAPGRYEAAFTPQEEGAYILTITGEGENNGQPYELRQVTGWVMAYSSEYNVRQESGRLLERMAAITGGRSMADRPEAVFEHNLVRQEASVPIWPQLLFIALLLWPIDIAVRRLIITRSDIQRLRQWLQVDEERPKPVSERIASLRSARERARQQTKHGERDLPQEAPSNTIGALRQRKAAAREQQAPQPVKTATETSSTPRYQPPKAQQPRKIEADEGENVAGRLLKRRKRREK